MTSPIQSPSLQPADESRLPQIHLGYLDGMRALAALFVLIHHSFLQAWPIGYHKFPHGITALVLGWLIYGHFAVDAFIVLSGFCLMLPVVRGDGTLRGGAFFFLKKRAHRILPTYYIALGFSLSLIWLFIGQQTGTHWDISVPVTTRGILTHLLLLQDIFPQTATQINHAYWSISVEWKIYFFFPLLVFAWRRFGGLPTTLVTVLLSIVAYKVLKDTRFSGLTSQYLGLFTMGLLGATIAFSSQPVWSRWRSKFSWHAVAAALLLVLCAICAKFGFTNVLYHIGYVDILTGIAVMSLLVAAAQPGPNRLHRCLSWKPLAFVGTFAYSIYLIHAPLLQVVTQYLCQPLHLEPLATFLVLALLAAPLIVGFSYLFFLVAERPFLNHRPAPQPSPKRVTAE